MSSADEGILRLDFGKRKLLSGREFADFTAPTPSSRMFTRVFTKVDRRVPSGEQATCDSTTRGRCRNVLLCKRFAYRTGGINWRCRLR